MGYSSSVWHGCSASGRKLRALPSFRHEILSRYPDIEARPLAVLQENPLNRAPRLALASLLAATIALPTAAQAAGALVPHRAVYDLSLDQASERSGITSIAGRMVYEFNGSACEGYTVTFRFVTRIDTSESSRLTDHQTTTYEGGSGESFDFVTRSYVDNALDHELRGTAEREDDGTSVSIEKPEPLTHELEATQFPTQHLLELIGKAEGGENFYETTIFDASEEADKVMTTTVVIGRKGGVETSDPEIGAIGDIAEDEFWPVDIAYFDMSSTEGEELPTYRISFKLYDNGVTRDLLMDYGDFTMAGRLVDLALFDAPADCPR
jgi:hypothetical protein